MVVLMISPPHWPLDIPPVTPSLSIMLGLDHPDGALLFSQLLQQPDLRNRYATDGSWGRLTTYPENCKWPVPPTPWFFPALPSQHPHWMSRLCRVSRCLLLGPGFALSSIRHRVSRVLGSSQLPRPAVSDIAFKS